MPNRPSPSPNTTPLVLSTVVLAGGLLFTWRMFEFDNGLNWTFICIAITIAGLVGTIVSGVGLSIDRKNAELIGEIRRMQRPASLSCSRCGHAAKLHVDGKGCTAPAGCGCSAAQTDGSS